VTYVPQQPDPSAPYGRDPVTGQPYSDKSRTMVGLLQLLLPFVGVCGVGRLAAGYTTIGIIQLVGFLISLPLICFGIGIFGALGIGIWSFVEGILFLTGNLPDPAGRPLRP
jgi:TM2 domain-containing membrane protein YozV